MNGNEVFPDLLRRFWRNAWSRAGDLRKTVRDERYVFICDPVTRAHICVLSERRHREQKNHDEGEKLLPFRLSMRFRHNSPRFK